jgi:hypothetical protein
MSPHFFDLTRVEPGELDLGVTVGLDRNEVDFLSSGEMVDSRLNFLSYFLSPWTVDPDKEEEEEEGLLLPLSITVLCD